MSQIPRIAASVLTVAALTIGVAFALRPNPPGSGIVTQASNGAQTPVNCSANQALIWNNSATLGCVSAATGFAVGAASARPVAVGSGHQYLCSDIPVLYTDTAPGIWTGQLSTFLAPPPTASSYTAVGNIALYQQADAVRAVGTINAATGAALAAGSLPQTTPWFVTFHAIAVQQQGQQFPEIAEIVSNGTTSGTSVSYNNGLYQDPGVGIHVTRDVLGTTTRQNTYVENSTTNAFNAANGGIHMRILNDGATMHMQLSNDGYLWQTYYGLDTPSGLTNYGFWIGNENNSAQFASAQILVLQQTLSTGPTVPQLTVTGATGNGVNPLVVNVSGTVTGNYFVGDYVSVKGMTGETAANTGSNNGPTGSLARVITAETSNTLSFGEVTGTGTWISGGTITLISR